jgi:hypothetical protein
VQGSGMLFLMDVTEEEEIQGRILQISPAFYSQQKMPFHTPIIFAQHIFKPRITLRRKTGEKRGWRYL